MGNPCRDQFLGILKRFQEGLAQYGDAWWLTWFNEPGIYVQDGDQVRYIDYPVEERIVVDPNLGDFLCVLSLPKTPGSDKYTTGADSVWFPENMSSELKQCFGDLARAAGASLPLSISREIDRPRQFLEPFGTVDSASHWCALLFEAVEAEGRSIYLPTGLEGGWKRTIWNPFRWSLRIIEWCDLCGEDPRLPWLDMPTDPVAGASGDNTTESDRFKAVRNAIGDHITAPRQVKILELLLDGSGKARHDAIIKALGDADAYKPAFRDLCKSLRAIGWNAGKPPRTRNHPWIYLCPIGSKLGSENAT